MKFTQSFAVDTDPIRFRIQPSGRSEPFAFVRFGDGESAIVAGRPYQTDADGWKYAGGDSELRRELIASLSHDAAGWCVGLPSPNREPEHYDECLPFVRVPQERRTFAKLFSDQNANPWRDWFRGQWPGNAFVVGSRSRYGHESRADVLVSPTWVMEFGGWESDPTGPTLVKELLDVRVPIYLSCGPMANIVARKYWEATEGPEWIGKRQPIIDAGSSIDPIVKGHTGRVYDNLGQHLWRKDTLA